MGRCSVPSLSTVYLACGRHLGRVSETAYGNPETWHGVGGVFVSSDGGICRIAWRGPFLGLLSKMKSHVRPTSHESFEDVSMWQSRSSEGLTYL